MQQLWERFASKHELYKYLDRSVVSNRAFLSLIFFLVAMAPASRESLHAPLFTATPQQAEARPEEDAGHRLHRSEVAGAVDQAHVAARSTGPALPRVHA